MEANKIRNQNCLIDYKKRERLINIKEKGINDDLVKKYFLVQDLEALLENFKN